MFDQSNMGPLFMVLSTEKEEEFRQYARDNDPPNLSSWEVYHPVCRDEWQKRGINPQKESMKCPDCGITVPGMPEDSTYEEQLCNGCYDRNNYKYE